MSQNILHRLTVRKFIIATLASLIKSCVTREAGRAEVIFKPTSGVTVETAHTTLAEALATQGFGYTPISAGLNNEGLVEAHFTNPIMSEQSLWGARGMSKAARAALGIGTLVAAPADPGQGEIPDEAPVSEAVVEEQVPVAALRDRVKSNRKNDKAARRARAER